jgi:hypothetical protein
MSTKRRKLKRKEKKLKAEKEVSHDERVDIGTARTNPSDIDFLDHSSRSISEYGYGIDSSKNKRGNSDEQIRRPKTEPGGKKKSV